MHFSICDTKIYPIIAHKILLSGINKEKKLVHFKLNNLPFKTATIKIFTVNKEHGSPYDKWKSMGMPELEYYVDSNSVLFDIFAVSAIPDFKTYSLLIEDGCLSIDFKLGIFETKAIEINLA